MRWNPLEKVEVYMFFDTILHKIIMYKTDS
jgi:hypothetical protein